jgi:hypothetical protein
MVNEDSERIRAFVGEFARCVMAQSEAMRCHKPDIGNKFAQLYLASATELISMGEAGIAAFAALLKDARLDVRTMAATELLPYRCDEALTVLEESSKEGGVIALGAIATLARWRDGEKGMWEEIARLAKQSNLPRNRNEQN